MCAETNIAGQLPDLQITILGQEESPAEGKFEAPLYQDSHPFEDRGFREFLQREFPDLTIDFAQVQLPGISVHPDELELWEVDQIKQRKSRKPPWESELRYLSRLLYEEFFSVDQNPGMPTPVIFRGVAGITPGGLISHFYSPNSIGGATLENVVLAAPKTSTLGEAVRTDPDFHNWRNLINTAVECTWPTIIGRANMFRPNFASIERKISLGQPYPEQLDSVGYRLIRMLVEMPAMMDPIEDVELRKMVNPRFPERPMSKIVFIRKLWEHSQPLLTDSGTYDDPNKPEVKKILRDLLIARTHPELQIFFRYFSPSGYINQGK